MYSIVRAPYTRLSEKSNNNNNNNTVKISTLPIASATHMHNVPVHTTPHHQNVLHDRNPIPCNVLVYPIPLPSSSSRLFLLVLGTVCAVFPCVNESLNPPFYDIPHPTWLIHSMPSSIGRNILLFLHYLLIPSSRLDRLRAGFHFVQAKDRDKINLAGSERAR